VTGRRPLRWSDDFDFALDGAVTRHFGDDLEQKLFEVMRG
jgi:hypothetical protein